MKQTYTGGCHCGAVKYEADVDLTKGTMRCNCSICSKSRTWLASAEDFRLLSGAESLTDYQFGSHRIHHLFCKHCGIKSFARGKGANDRDMHVIVVNCLDIPDAELAALPVMYIDGRHNNFKAPPAETRHM